MEIQGLRRQRNKRSICHEYKNISPLSAFRSLLSTNLIIDRKSIRIEKKFEKWKKNSYCYVLKKIRQLKIWNLPIKNDISSHLWVGTKKSKKLNIRILELV